MMGVTGNRLLASAATLNQALPFSTGRPTGRAHLLSACQQITCIITRQGGNRLRRIELSDTFGGPKVFDEWLGDEPRRGPAEG